MLPGEIVAVGALTFLSNAGTLLDDGTGQVVRMIDTCGRGGHISTGTEHGESYVNSSNIREV